MSNIVKICISFNEKTKYEMMLRLFKKTFFKILSFSQSLTIKFISLSNQAFLNRPTLIDLSPGLC